MEEKYVVTVTLQQVFFMEMHLEPENITLPIFFLFPA